MKRYLPAICLFFLFMAWPSHCVWKSYRYHTIPPSFAVEVRRSPGNTLVLNISPNYIVRSIYRVAVSHKGVLLFELKEVVDGEVAIDIKQIIPAGESLDVECDLQYDRFVPSLITLSKRIIVR